MKLTAKQTELLNSLESVLRKQVALEYIKNGYENGTLAYLNACTVLNRKPSKNPETSASEILNYPNVVAFLNSIKEKVAEEVQIDAEWVLRQAKNSYEINATTYESQGGAMEMVNATAAGKFLEMCGKHVNVRAFDGEQKKADEPITNIRIEVVGAS